MKHHTGYGPGIRYFPLYTICGCVGGVHDASTRKGSCAWVCLQSMTCVCVGGWVHLGLLYKQKMSRHSNPGALVFEVGSYHPRKRIHVGLIRVVFRDQAMYARTSFGGAKNVHNWKKKKRCVFSHSDTFWERHDGQIKKNSFKNTYLGSIFIPDTCL